MPDASIEHGRQELAGMAGKNSRVRLKAAKNGSAIISAASAALVSTMGSHRPAPALLTRTSGIPTSRMIAADVAAIARASIRLIG
jgi:hypothetical protein